MRLLARTLTFIGAVAVIVAVIGVVVLVRAARGGFSARDQPSGLETFIARTMRSWSTPARAKGMKNPIPASPEGLAEARAHFADHCATCHANDGSGDTDIGRNIYPKAPDMRAPATQGLTDGELYSIIENGVRLTAMPAWGAGGGHSEESWKLVSFIRHLPSLTVEEKRQMERLNPKGPEEDEHEDQDSDLHQAAGGSAPARHEHGHHEHSH